MNAYFKDFVQSIDEEKEDGFCARLLRSMYGTQDASHVWECEYSVTLVDGGFRRGVSNGALFFCVRYDIRLPIHGDDFVALSDMDGHQYLEALPRAQCELKCGGEVGLPFGSGCEMVVLNRVLRFALDAENRHRFEYEAHQRHVEVLLKQLKLEKFPDGIPKYSELRLICRADVCCPQRTKMPQKPVTIYLSSLS